jgi:MAF protein
MKLILASESPRRRELLRQCGIDCDVMAVPVAEEIRAGENPEEMALRLAREKARSASRHFASREVWILAADTVVADGPCVMGKPRDRRQAEEFLLRLRAREHRVITGVCLLRLPSGEETTEVAVTAVRMRNYSASEISGYLESGDAMDKAGAYAIQHPAFRPVESIAGCYTNVVGLPLCRVYRLLERAGEKLNLPLPDGCRTGRECGLAPVPDQSA